MKKIRILCICALILAFTCIALAGCSKPDKITSINLKDIDPEAVIEMQMGNFDLSEYTVVVNYESGSIEEKALSEDMISELDRLKFYQPGEHVITVSHGKHTCEFKISVKREVFGELKFPENNVFTYDGQEHGVELEGDIPSNATISYIGGNKFVNAGDYDVTAVVTCNGYVTEKITTTVTIERAKYDMGNVKLEPMEVVYDGTEHSIVISGELPEGVAEPTYYIDGNALPGVVDVGEYTVTAVFSVNDPNYDMIPSLETTLKITPAEYDVSELEITFKTEKGASLLGPWKTYDGKSVTIDVDNGGTFKNDVAVLYTVRDENGNEISNSNNNTGIKNAGVYTIGLEFILLDDKNYKEIEPMEIIFEVFQNEYETSKLYMDSKIVEFDGKKHSLSLKMPKELENLGIEVHYEYYRVGEYEAIKENGENVKGVSDAGEYTVKAIFTVNDPNYEPIDPVKATLVIEKKEIVTSAFDFDNTALKYTGKSVIPELGFEVESYLGISDISVFKLDGDKYIEISEAVDIGEYRAEVTVSLLDTVNYELDNGYTSLTLICDFTIEQAEIDISNLGFKNSNPLFVNKGESLALEFDSKNVDGLDFEVSFYKINGNELSLVTNAETVVPNNEGVICVSFDSSELNEGTYICAITVSAKNSNFVLSSGDAVAEFYFEFEILS